jgi:pilus assembly protein CpaE
MAGWDYAMRQLTAGLVIKRAELLLEAERCCQELARHVVVEKGDGAHWPGFLEWLKKTQPHVLLVDVEHLQNAIEERVGQIKRLSPESMIIAVHHTADSQMIIAGMRAGLDEYLYPPLARSLRDVLERKIDEYTKSQFLTNSDRKTIAFLSAKGGCGGTTVACHMAVELGKRMHHAGSYHVLLADLDVTGGNVRFLMRSPTPSSILDAMETTRGLDVPTWNQMISNGHPGLEVISAPAAGVPRLPEQRELERVLNFARMRYQWSVLDLGCCLNQYNLSILDSLNDLYLVASPDVLALFQVKQIMTELHKHSFPDERIHLILNRNVDYEDKLVAEEAQKMLGIRAYFSLPNDYSGLTEAYASGNLLSERSPLGSQISALASKVSGIDSWGGDEQRHEPWYRKFRGARR